MKTILRFLGFGRLTLDYRTLDCRNGIHPACDICACRCHKNKHD